MKYKCLEKVVNKPKKSKILTLTNKLLIGVLIGIISLVSMEIFPSFKNYMNENILNKNLSFGKISTIYNKYFSNILNENTKEVFSEKIKYNNIEKINNKYILTVEENYLVPVIETGVIVFIGTYQENENTIIIEQIDGINTIYQNINTNNVKLYDYINAGEFLGETINNTLILQSTKNGETINIEEYLS